MDDYMCALCTAAPITRRYYENRFFWIADCATCGVPMVVLTEHKILPDRWIRDEMLQVCRKLFDMSLYDIDYDNRQIKNHYHFHLRLRKQEVEDAQGNIEDNSKEAQCD